MLETCWLSQESIRIVEERDNKMLQQGRNDWKHTGFGVFLSVNLNA